MDDLEHEDELVAKLAQVALENGINRSLVKRNVMTYAYSSAQFGFRNQIMEDTIRPIDTQVLTGRRESNPYSIEIEGRMDGGFKVANYLAGKIYRAVTSTVAKAEAGMAFFKQVASTLAHEGQPLVWQNPLGMPIVHKYAVWDMKRVEMFLFGNVKVGKGKEGTDGLSYIRASVRTKPTSKIDKHKARSAVAPNVIHSMDGAHLLLTVIAAKDEGYSSFALIHDSFGVHAGKTERFFTIIREAFVEMYEAYDPFEEILEAAKAVLSDKGIEKLPEVPEKGQLDLRQIIVSDYAFA
jgi:DNA-directed RNA polymerase